VRKFVTRQEELHHVSQIRFINPEALAKPPGYTHVVEATTPARLVYIAGQLGLDRDGKLSSDFRLQAVQTFENLKAALAAVGAQFWHVVKLNNYLTDTKYLPVFRQVRDSYLEDKNRPASTTIAISGLAREGALLEIEAVAVLPLAASPAAASKSRSKVTSKKRGRSSSTKAAR
jgi:enamine deaminase RidA (YjgF/YER057c/UK114 family)